MTKTVLCALALAAASMTASAANVTYTTAVTWDCNGVSGCGVSGNDLTIGSLILRYAPNGATVNAPLAPGSTGAGFGELIALCASAGACDTLTNITGAQITVQINQSVPFAQSTSFTGVLGGSISSTQSLSPAVVTFSPLSSFVTDGTTTVNYYLQQPEAPVNGYILNSINDNIATSLQGAINMDEAVPEPSTVALIGLGLLAVGFGRRKANVDAR